MAGEGATINNVSAIKRSGGAGAAFTANVSINKCICRVRRARKFREQLEQLARVVTRKSSGLNVSKQKY